MIRFRFALYCWGVLAYNVIVILWGAYVRATGSGAGCGSHWPSCNGELIPRAPGIETMIEFTHRLTSGVALLLVFGMAFLAWKAYPKGNMIRKGAAASVTFIVLEALLGAGLVLFGWVAENDSVSRALSMAIHLANTFLLLGAITLTAWWASGGSPLHLREQGVYPWFFGLGMTGIIFLGMSGAITALGDTLFPSGSLLEGIQQDFSPAAHFSIRMRLFHPLIAMVCGIYLFVLAGWTAIQRPTQWNKRLCGFLVVIFFIQVVAGIVNVALLAPIGMQIIHLLLADLIWIVFVLLAASALSSDFAPSMSRIGESSLVGHASSSTQ